MNFMKVSSIVVINLFYKSTNDIILHCRSKDYSRNPILIQSI